MDTPEIELAVAEIESAMIEGRLRMTQELMEQASQQAKEQYPSFPCNCNRWLEPVHETIKKLFDPSEARTVILIDFNGIWECLEHTQQFIEELNPIDTRPLEGGPRPVEYLQPVFEFFDRLEILVFPFFHEESRGGRA
jgi:hypothetical protein